MICVTTPYPQPRIPACHTRQQLQGVGWARTCVHAELDVQERILNLNLSTFATAIEHLRSRLWPALCELESRIFEISLKLVQLHALMLALGSTQDSHRASIEFLHFLVYYIVVLVQHLVYSWYAYTHASL